MRKTKRYEEGGDVEAEDSGGKFDEGTYARARKFVETASKEPATFGEAFKAARGAGDKEFTFKGKRYTTKMASDKNPSGAISAEGRSVSTPKPYSPTVVSKLPNEEPGLEESGPLESMLGPVKVAGALGAGALAAMKGAKAIKAARAARAGQAARAEQTALSRMEGEGGVAKTVRKPRPARAPARNLDEERMAGEGGPNFRRGGKVGSASRRADGIATKGKTKGRII